MRVAQNQNAELRLCLGEGLVQTAPGGEAAVEQADAEEHDAHARDDVRQDPAELPALGDGMADEAMVGPRLAVVRGLCCNQINSGVRLVVRKG